MTADELAAAVGSAAAHELDSALNRIQHCLRHRQFCRLQRIRERIQSLPLVRCALPLHRRPTVTSHRIDEVDSRHHRRGRFHRVPVIHENRHQRLFDRRHRRTPTDRVFPQPVERRTPHVHETVELIGLVDAV